MRHRSLTCRHHPNLRWSTKSVAWSIRPDGSGFYNGSRNIFFCGEVDGTGLYSDGSGVSCRSAAECSCPASDLILSPEDANIVGDDE